MVRIKWVDCKTTWGDEPSEVTRPDRPVTPALPDVTCEYESLAFDDDVTADYIPQPADLDPDPTLVDAPALGATGDVSARARRRGAPTA